MEYGIDNEQGWRGSSYRRLLPNGPGVIPSSQVSLAAFVKPYNRASKDTHPPAILHSRTKTWLDNLAIA